MNGQLTKREEKNQKQQSHHLFLGMFKRVRMGRVEASLFSLAPVVVRAATTIMVHLLCTSTAIS